MSANSTLAVTLSADAAEKLSAIAARDNSTPSALAALAVADLIDREAATLAAIERGRAEIRAGLGVPQEQVMRDVRDMIEAARVRP